MRNPALSVALFLFVIGLLLVMAGSTGGGLFFFLPGMASLFVASIIFVRQKPQP